MAWSQGNHIQTMATYAQPYPSYQQQPQLNQQQPQQQQQRSDYVPATQQRSDYIPATQQRSDYVPATQQQQPSSWMQPPYAGAPPMPANVSANPRKWNDGFWQFNTAFNSSRSSSQHVPWVPGHNWMPQSNQPPQQPVSSASQQQQQPAQQASHNPYKRAPRAPSAEYLATELVDNPLGLSGLELPNKHYDKVETPWVWQPRNLDEEDEEESSPNHPSIIESPSNSRKNSDNTTPDQQSESFTSRRELKPTFSPSIVRTPDHYRRSSSGSIENHSPSRTSSRGSRNSLESVLSARMSQLTTGSGTNGSYGSSGNPNSSTRQSSTPTSISSYSISPTKADFLSAPILGEQLSDEPSSMLSPLIMSHTPKSSASPLRSLRSHYTHPIISPSLDPIPESHSRDGTRSTPSKSRPAPVGPSSSLPSISSSQMYGAPGPSPLRGDIYERERERDRDRDRDRERDRDRDRDRDRSREPMGGLGSRHTTFIDPHISSNPYTSKPTNPMPRSDSPSTPSPRHTSSRSSSRQSSRPSSAHASPTYPSSHITPPTGYPISPRPSPPRHHSKHSPPDDHHGYSNSQHTTHRRHYNSDSTTTIRPSTYSSTSESHTHVPKMSNPLPPPPRDVHSGRLSYSHIPVQRSPPEPLEDRVRYGYWNRRGDHLTSEGYIVYCPHEKSFPNELRNYPAEDEGYQDHDGKFSAWLSRPELPESLPRQGRQPERPYDSFVIYQS